MTLPISASLTQQIVECAQNRQQTVEALLTEWLYQTNSLSPSNQAPEIKLSPFFDILPVGVALLNEDRQIVQINTTLEKILDMSMADLQARHYRTRQYIHPNGTTIQPEEFPSSRAFREQKAIFDVEIGVIKADDSVIWVSVNAAPLPNHQGVVTVTTDITAKKNVELELHQHQNHLEELVAERTRELELANQKLQKEIQEREIVRLALLAEKQQSETILTHTADSIVLADIHGDIIYVNPAWEQATGYSLAEVQGKNMRLLQSGQTARATYEALRQTIFQGNIWTGEFFNKRQNGTVFHTLETIVPVKNLQGEIHYFVGVARDITDERRLAKMKEEFVANAAHDLNNPLTVLKAGLYMLKYDPTQLESRIEIFEEQINRLQALVDDLLTLSRLDRGFFEPNFSPTDLNRLVARVIRSQTALADEKHIQIQFEPNASLPMIKADSQLLERVFVNLLANAINYTPAQGHVKINLEVSGEFGVFRIQDTGIGIGSEDLPHIFERFYRSATACQTAVGTGLGLSIVKAIIDLHDGKIEVNSTEGHGTEFKLYMPIFATKSPSAQ